MKRKRQQTSAGAGTSWGLTWQLSTESSDNLLTLSCSKYVPFYIVTVSMAIYIMPPTVTYPIEYEIPRAPKRRRGSVAFFRKEKRRGQSEVLDIFVHAMLDRNGKVISQHNDIGVVR